METIVTGGSIYNRLGVLVGPMCEASLEPASTPTSRSSEARASPPSGVWNHNALIVAAQRKMIAAAEAHHFRPRRHQVRPEGLESHRPVRARRFTIVTDTRPHAEPSKRPSQPPAPG
jgi:hypothetical protein